MPDKHEVGGSSPLGPTKQASKACLRYSISHGGDDGIRTHDPLLAGQVLSQLSYTPILGLFAVSPFFQIWGRICILPFLCVSIELFSRTASRKVSSPLQSLTSVFGMGTGGPSAFVTLTTQEIVRFIS